MNKNYNIYRKKMFMPEYGRHIHDMVDELLTIEDRDERNRKARVLIDIMGNLQPQLRDSAEYAHKLWDHLFIMSDFKLDVDSPYPVPTRESFDVKPVKQSYPGNDITMKHYGKNVRTVIKTIEKSDDQRLVQAVVNNLARYMRTKSYEYNQEHPNNEVIIKDIKSMSENGIIMDEEAINHIKSEYKQPFNGRNKKAQFQKKNNKNQKNNHRHAAQNRNK